MINRGNFFPILSFLTENPDQCMFLGNCPPTSIKQLLDEVFRDIQNYQGRGKCYQPKPKVEADNTNSIF